MFKRTILLFSAITLILFTAIAFETVKSESTDGQSCNSLRDCAQKAMEAAFETKVAIRVAVPKGAVMAFNLPNCPEGWVPFTELAGRTVIGSGLGTGSDFTERKLGDSGGSEHHLLTVPELPKHSMSIDADRRWGDHWTGVTGFSAADGSQGGGTLSSRTIGEDKPFPIVPPFYVLTYCERT